MRALRSLLQAGRPLLLLAGTTGLLRAQSEPPVTPPQEAPAPSQPAKPPLEAPPIQPAPQPVAAQESPQSFILREADTPKSFAWGGYAKARGALSWPGRGTLLQPEGNSTFKDQALTGRLNLTYAFRKGLDLELHYEAGTQGGDLWKAERQWDVKYPGLFDQTVLPDIPPTDHRRLFRLTRWMTDRDGAVAYQRLDRLALSIRQDWGLLRIGRQAVTWGNGLVFNPMDLFNPFSPIDTEREYKVGDDMVFCQVPLSRNGDVQALYVPRRDPLTGKIRWDQSSLAGKVRLTLGESGWDFMAAKHYDDKVLGVGSSGNLGQAAWRSDVSYTFLGGDALSSGFFSFVANVDTSWTLKGRSCYGLVELYHSGLGSGDYSAQTARPEVRARLLRGELFALGRTYLSGQFRIELHPLCTASVTLVSNLDGPSQIVMPRLVWDLSQGFRLTVGGSLFRGATGKEFGGFKDPATGLLQKYPDKAFAWVAYYF